jgi:ATPase subunit of ABC transporter with duplicated ATPase domains
VKESGDKGYTASSENKAFSTPFRPAAKKVVQFSPHVDRDASSVSNDVPRQNTCDQQATLPSFTSDKQQLFDDMTVIENVCFPLEEHRRNLSKEEVTKIALEKLKMVGLDPKHNNKLPSQISGGMQKRTGLARALALDPEILIYDEPTTGVDPLAATLGRWFGASEADLRLVLPNLRNFGGTQAGISYPVDLGFLPPAA